MKLDDIIELNFDYSIIPYAKENPEIQNFKNGELQTFDHEFYLENEGPSPTAVSSNFFIYIPDIVDENTTISFAPSGHTTDSNGCMKTVIKNADKLEGDEGIQNSCKTGCSRFECTLLKGLEKNLRVTALLKMAFTSKSAKKTSEKFSITSAVKINGKYASTTTNFQKTVVKVGEMERTRKVWPIIVGVLVGIIIVAVIMFLAYKKGLLSKLRFARNAMDEDVRKSRIGSNSYQNQGY